MNREMYVLLTGGKNNAGDYLIKHRAKQLFAQLRPDRQIIDYDAWNTFTDQQLDIVNKSKALILCGGPALQFNMYPAIYPMVKNLEEIKVPIIMMGTGWKSLRGDWIDTHNYVLSEETQILLNKIESSGYLSSVRDYHTLNSLNTRGYKNVLMTGCPALYDLNYINTTATSDQIKSVSFSAGVSFTNSKNMDNLQKECILRLKEYFKNSNFTVVFHHSIDEEKHFKSYKKLTDLYYAQKSLVNWLNENQIEYIDISGGEEKLIGHYNSCDFHIGFRVHAHIYMSSISKKSILISEDGRGKALQKVISGLIFDGYSGINMPKKKFFGLIKVSKDTFTPNNDLPKDLINSIDYELKHKLPRLTLTRKNIDSHFEVMKNFLQQLP